ncbi:MAG: site-2 protease family protein [Bacteroidota bacterium]
MENRLQTYALHLALFLLTFLTTAMVGTELSAPKLLINNEAVPRFWFTWFFDLPEHLQGLDLRFSFSDLYIGLPYSIAFLTFLTFHEFGHYFAALYHRVKTTLPYYIPIYLPLPILNIGSFGAVIRLKQMPESTRKYFDIGIAGPLAGFVISLVILVYGFSTLPPTEVYLTEINPDYQHVFGGVPSENEIRTYVEENGVPTYFIGTSLLFEILKEVVPSDPTRVPNHFELIHYPLLFVGYITLFFTALNLLPIGQLDGGHIIYGMFGPRVSGAIARLAVIGLILLGGTGLVDIRAFAGSWQAKLSELLTLAVYIAFLVYILIKILGPHLRTSVYMLSLLILATQVVIKWNLPALEMNFIWLFYAFLVVRMLGVDHPPAYIEHRVNGPRQLLGWISIIIFILCFTPTPIQIVGA